MISIQQDRAKDQRPIAKDQLAMISIQQDRAKDQSAMISMGNEAIWQ